jgi:hypothetical protein
MKQFATNARDWLEKLLENNKKLYFVFDGYTIKSRFEVKKERSKQKNFSTSLYFYLFIQILHEYKCKHKYNNKIEWEVAQGLQSHLVHSLSFH